MPKSKSPNGRAGENGFRQLDTVEKGEGGGADPSPKRTPSKPGRPFPAKGSKGKKGKKGKIKKKGPGKIKKKGGGGKTARTIDIVLFAGIFVFIGCLFFLSEGHESNAQPLGLQCADAGARGCSPYQYADPWEPGKCCECSACGAGQECFRHGIPESPAGCADCPAGRYNANRDPISGCEGKLHFPVPHSVLPSHVVKSI